MYISQVEMAVELNSKRYSYPKYLSGESAASSSTIRPLGLLRNVRELDINEDDGDNCTHDFYRSESECSQTLTEHIDDPINVSVNFAESTEIFLEQDQVRNVNSKEYLTPRVATHHHEVSDLKNSDTKSINKKVIQLPMLKINLESITGAKYSEDSKTLESTRRSLRTLINDSKRAVQVTDIKNYQFITPSGKNNSQSQFIHDEKKSRTFKIPKHTVGKKHPVRLSPADKLQLSTKTHSSRCGKNQDPISSVAFTNQVCDLSICDSTTYYSTYCDGDIPINKRNADNDGADDLIIDLIQGTKSSSGVTPVNIYDMDAWPSYEDIQQTRRWSNKGCSKHDYLLKKHRFQEELMEQRIRARKDLALSWVNINNSGYKASPILRYTTYQGTKLEPVSVPSHNNDHCPMCSLYRTERIPTACPPNTPKGNTTDVATSLEPMNEDDLRIQKFGTEEASASSPSTDHFQDVRKLEPITSSRMAKKQGFRGSKTPISFKMGLNKGTS